MEAQMQRPAHQHIEHEDDPQDVGEKKSVMKKVKDKARKIKDTLKKPSQGQGQEHEYRYEENVDEEDDDDEEIAKDPEVHGAPTHDSTVISSKNLENPADTREDRIDPMVEGQAKARPNIPAQTGYEQEKPPESKHFPSPMKPISMQGGEANAGEPEVNLGPSMGLGEDPPSPKIGARVPPSNYESKLSDPTGDGGKEAGVAPLIRRFDNLEVDDESETKPAPEQRPFTGSDNQFSPTQDQFNPESNQLTTQDNTESGPKSFDSNTTEGMPRDTTTGKVSSATSALTDKAVYAKNLVASKLGYGGAPEKEGTSPSHKPGSESTPGYTQRITETLNPVYEKVAGAGTAVMSKFQGGGEAVNQGIASGQEGISPSNKPESESTPGYTKRITDTLNPVYDKVAGAGTAVMSKFQGGGGATATGADKGVSSRDYWAEKLKPGDEDKALSEAITDALHKKKEGYLHKTGEEKPMGKVTESEEVATRLGTGVEGKREGEDALDAGRESSGPGVVGRVKDAVGSWIGKGTGTQTAQDSINETYVDKAGVQSSSQE
ncbi:low-temperature-induced 65 kDa protein-like isoform X2 [Primulina huaijiensis]|uniref:low-temperature-induced 65 kDa protein-like isoform X2 n=1 Tax=Primulina huaijiensis TaxID=1492673 RepID=UPI003CC787FD